MKSAPATQQSWTSRAATRGRTARGRAGHTLFEILLALGLSLVLLTAVYAALDQHWRYAEAGQRQTERMQVTRALFERISLDLRSVVFRPAASFAATSRDLIPAGSGIRGDAETLLVRVHTPDDARSRVPHTVRWAIGAFNPGGPDAVPAAPPRAAAVALTTPTSFGLARIVEDEASPGSLSASKTASARDLLADEVETIRFRYFARGSWFDRWDSVVQGELPRAVEITIGFRRATAAEPAIGGRNSAGTYRLIVPIPASEA